MGKIKLSAADLYTGTLPDSRFPEALPSLSGANITDLNASNIASGELNAARLPLATGSVRGSVIVGSNISVSSGTISLSSSNVTGALGFTPIDVAKIGAASGVASLDSSTLVPAAQLPLTAGATRGAVIVGSNLTLSSGTVSLTSGNVVAALTFTPLDASKVGQANGVASLDSSTLVPSAQLPLAAGSTRGAVIVGSNLTLTSGTVSLASSNVTAALGFTPADAAKIGQASGIASLDSSTLVPTAQLPLAAGSTRGAVIVGSNLTLSSGTVSLASSNVTAALGFTPADAAKIGEANGIASLDSSTLVPAAQLPAATASVKGAVIVGSNISLSSGTISLSSANVTAALGFTPLDAAKLGQANGVASLDGSGLIPSSQLPAIAVTDTFEVATQAAMLALTAQKGDVAIRTDLSKTFILADTDASVLANWKELKTPTDLVLSVNGQTGTVSLTSSNISEGTNLYYTDARFDTRLAAKSTSNLTEGTNLYYTDARFDTRFGTKSTSNLTEGTNLYWTNDRFDTRLAASNLNASKLTSGSVSDSLLSSNVVLRDANGRVGLGTSTTLTERLEVNGKVKADQVILAADPTVNLQAATKQYVDTAVSSAQANVTTLTNDLATETSTRASADTALSTRISARPFAQMTVLGVLSEHATAGGIHDFYLNTDGAKTLRKIAVTCPNTPASGTIVVDIKVISTQGGAATSLFTAKTKPTITCANGVAWATLTGTALDDKNIPDNSVVVVTVISAAANSEELRVELFE